MVKKIYLNKLEHIIRKYWIILFILGTGVYFVSCVVINFIGKPWYNIDMYSDALVAELMADEMTLFPSSWTFGNQYYVVATPVLGAVFYKFIGDSFYAMALASSVMMAVIYLSYWWCLKPFLNKKSLAVGLFVLSGGIIFGTSSCEYQYGFQIFYTMASYYACYIVGVFLTLGLSLRIYTGMPFHKIWFPIVIVMNFALGMQSLRETLILNIPLVIISLYLFILKKCHYKENIFFSVGIFLSNFSGIIVIKILVKIMNIKSYTIISKFSLRTDIQQILEHFFREIDNLFKFTGLYFVYYIKVNSVFIIIFLGALLTVLSVILSVAFILVKKDTSPLAIAVLCCFVSVISVFGVGVLFFENRIIYYFIWYILSVLSVCYFLNRLISKKLFVQSY